MIFYRSDAIQKYIFNGLKNVTPNYPMGFMSVYHTTKLEVMVK